MGESLAGSDASVCGDSPYNEVQMCFKKKKAAFSFLCDLAEVFFFFPPNLEHV